MSYDFAIEVDTGGQEPVQVEPYFTDIHPDLQAAAAAGTVVLRANGGHARCGNYTSNVSPIWAKCLTAAADTEAEAWIGWWVIGKRCKISDGRWVRAYPKPDDCIHLADLTGKLCGDLADLFAAAVRWGIDHLADLRALEPDNGWGNAEGAITYLWDLQRMCEAHPKANLYVSH